MITTMVGGTRIVTRTKRDRSKVHTITLDEATFSALRGMVNLEIGSGWAEAERGMDRADHAAAGEDLARALNEVVA